MDLKKFIAEKLLTEVDQFKASRETIGQPRQNVWHAMTFENAEKAVDEMVLKPYTSQRYWPDGRRRKDNEPDYEDSYWMYGWSMTRNKEFAMNWKGVVLELDLSEIKHRFQVKPFSWNYLMTHKADNRKEHEEFVVAAYVAKSIPQLKQEDEDISEQIDELYDLTMTEKDPDKLKEIREEIERLHAIPSWFSRWSDFPYGRELDLNKCLKGIHIDINDLKYYSDSPILKKLIEHDKFKGFFESQKDKGILKNKPKP